MEKRKDTRGRNLKNGEDQMKDGRYRYRYTDKDGKRKTVYSWRLVQTDKTPHGKKAGQCLRQMEKDIQKDLEDGIRVSQTNTLSVYDMILRYFKTKPQIANSTMQNYLHMVDKNIKPSNLGKMPIGNVKKSDVKEFYAYLYRDKKFAASTLQLYQNIIFPAFQMAVDDDIIRKNPSKDCMKDYSRGGLSSTKYPLTREEQSSLLNFLEKDSVYSKYYVLISFMLATGCRIGEVIGITWNDISLEKRIVSVNHQIIYKKEILAPEFTHSGYNAVWTDEKTDEWLMQVKDGIVCSCSRTGGKGGWQLFSVSRWNREDGKRLKRHLELEFEKKQNRQIYWDDVAMFCHFEEYELGIYPMQEGDLIEIDDFSELCDLDPSYCGYEAQGQEKSEEK